MKVLSLTQPYATLIAIGAKRIETRSWATPYRGPLAIHAAQGLGPVGGKRGLLDLIEQEPFWSTLRGAYAVQLGDERHYPGDAETIANEMPLGALVAMCELVDCAPTANVGAPNATTATWRRDDHWWLLTDQERAFGDYSAGRWVWLLSNIRALPKPIPARGALGLWEWQEEIGL